MIYSEYSEIVEQSDKSAEMVAFKAALSIIVSLFKSDDGDNITRDNYLLGISNRLSRILGELSFIRQTLNDVKVKLEEIEVKIDDLPFQIALMEVRAIQDHINEEFPYWASSGEDTILNAAHDARTKLILNNRILMRSGKFSYAYDLAISFLYELGMSFLLNVPKETVRNSAAFMFQYLDQASNPNRPGSLGDTILVAEMTIRRLLQWESELDRKSEVTTKIIHDQGMTHWSSCTWNTYTIITGSLDEGLRVSYQKSEPRDCRSGPYGRGGPPMMLPIDRVNKLSFDTRGLVAQSVLDENTSVYKEQKKISGEISEILPGINLIKSIIKNRLDNQLLIS